MRFTKTIEVKEPPYEPFSRRTFPTERGRVRLAETS
jgi:hypothetical protein